MFWSEYNLFDTQIIFLKEFFEKVDFEKKSADDKRSMKKEAELKIHNVVVCQAFVCVTEK